MTADGLHPPVALNRISGWKDGIYKVHSPCDTQCGSMLNLINEKLSSNVSFEQSYPIYERSISFAPQTKAISVHYWLFWFSRTLKSCGKCKEICFCNFVHLLFINFNLPPKVCACLNLLEYLAASPVLRQTTASLRLAAALWSFSVHKCRPGIYHRAERCRQKRVLTFLKGHIPLILIAIFVLLKQEHLCLQLKKAD